MKQKGAVSIAQQGFEGWLVPPAVTRIFGDLRFRIDTPALAIAFAADGTAWSVEEEGILRHWNTINGQELAHYQLSDLETVWAFSVDAALVASGGTDFSIWETKGGRYRFTVAQHSWVTAMAFRPDGSLIATGHDNGGVQVCDTATGRSIVELATAPAAISALAFSPDGKHLAAAAEDRVIRLWSIPDGAFRGELRGHTDRIDALAWHPNGRILVSAGWDMMARVWNVNDLDAIILLNAHAEVVSALAFSSDGRLLATADSEQVIWLWDPLPGKVLKRLSGHIGEVQCLAFSPDNKFLLSGGQDRRLLLWDLATGQTKCGVSSAQAGRGRISLSADESLLACADGSDTVRVLDASTGALRQQLTHPADVQAIAYSKHGDWLAVGDAAGVIHLWHPTEVQPVRRLHWHRQGITALAFSPDGDMLVSGGGTDGYVYLWSPKNDEPVLLMPEAADGCTVETVTFFPDGRLIACGGVDWLATGGSDGAICVWDYTRRHEVATLSSGTVRLVVRPDGKQLAAASLVESIILYDLTTKTLTKELIGHHGLVTCLAYSPDGNLLATGGEDGMLHLWITGSVIPSRRDAEDLSRFDEPDVDSLAAQVNLHAPLCDLLFSADGRWLYTANANSTCYVMDVQRLLDDD
jgi:WD40 repeat protein